MTEEQNYETQEQCNCICKSKGFRKFLIVALGSFVGVFCALSLFAALHKPPMPHHRHCQGMMRPPVEQNFDGMRQFGKKEFPPFHKERKAPIDMPAPQAQK